MPTRRRAPPSDPRAELRALAHDIAENAAVTIAMADLADGATRDVFSAVAPTHNHAAGARLLSALDVVRARARRGRDLARRLVALLPVAPSAE